ncbi:MAG TPA: tRNA guanosine(34) transglycosylase Tgt, partial [Thermoleophilaceae bacterium]|nr:tRNA guanosine(34) transglycosylase Tgt [Thermoleophilaceae bacterium]
TYDDLRDASAERVASTPGLDGIAVGGSLGQEKEQMHAVVERSLRPAPDEWPRHLLGIGDVDVILAAVRAGIDTFDCATPTRLARHGTALVPDPERRWKIDLTKSEWRDDPRPLFEGAATPHSRAYLHYLAKGRELTGARILTLHNLDFMARLMSGIRAAIRDGSWEQYAEKVLAGEEPYG